MGVEGRFDPLVAASDAHSDIIRMTNGHAPKVWGGRVLIAEDYLRTLPVDVQERAMHLFNEWWGLFHKYYSKRNSESPKLEG